jgi:hypothetical protein
MRMTRGVRKYLVGSVVLVALIAVAGCSRYLLAEREPWRHDAEIACINSGVAEEIPGRVRISSIQGGGACGIDYPLKVSELGENKPLGYDDEPMRPPGAIPNASMPQQWPLVQRQVQAQPLPPPQYNPQASPQYAQPQSTPQPYHPAPYTPQPYTPQPYEPPPPAPIQAGAPMSLSPPGGAPPGGEPYGQGGAPHPYYNAPAASRPAAPDVEESDDDLFSPRPMMPPPGTQQASPESAPIPPLGPPAPMTTGGTVQVEPAVTLACPLVSVLDKWIAEAVQPAALKWFRQPVVEIKQLGGYSCRGMVNGNPNAPISEHAFGNAIDIAEFDLADGHKISVQYGWHGTPEEQGFLHDVQGAACRDFTTVLAPGANVYHYNHIHVDLMRRRGRPYICEPTAIPGDVVAARARAHYAAQHYGVTGSIKPKPGPSPSLSYSGDDHLPDAVPGDD